MNFVEFSISCIVEIFMIYIVLLCYKKISTKELILNTKNIIIIIIFSILFILNNLYSIVYLKLIYSICLNIVLNILKLIVKGEVKKIGIENTSKFIRELSFGTYNKQIKDAKTDYDWLTSSEEEINKYINDPLVGKDTTGSLFYELLDGMVYTSKLSNIKKMKELPLLLLSGLDDPVGSKGNGVKKLENIYKKNNIDVSLKLYEGKRHDLFHETNKLEVFNDILTYIKKEL